MVDLTLRWCLIANVVDPHPTKFRVGARVVLLSAQAERPGRMRYEVRGLSIGGRVITAFVRPTQLARLRVGQARLPAWYGFATKAEAVVAVTQYNWTEPRDSVQ